jgi:hypothetical protein
MVGMKPPRHVYLDDSTKDHRGEGRCVECGTPRSNERHELPDMAEANEESRRRTGEGGA